MRVSTPANHALSFEEQIHKFELCTNDFASNLLCVATDKKLTLGIVRFPVIYNFLLILLSFIYI